MLLKTQKSIKRLNDCVERHPKLESCKQSIWAAFNELKRTFSEGGQLLICGNGGSAADADHISGELLKGFGHKRPLSMDWELKLGSNLARNLQGALPAVPLTVFNSLSSAYANDCDGDYTFAQLTWGLGRVGDALLGISTSGNSENVLNALDVAKAKDIIRIGLTGKNGGRMRSRVDICICVPEEEVYKIQELHLPVYHTLCLMLEDEFFK